MSDRIKQSLARRAFFLRGSAVLGAGLASATGASAFVPDASLPLREQLDLLRQRLGALEDKEAVRQLFLAYLALLESQAFDAALTLFTEDARVEINEEGFRGQDIRKFLTGKVENSRTAEMHTAFRQEPCRQQDVVSVSEDRRRASGCFHARVRVSMPLAGNSSLESMARLQGLDAQSRWEAGRFEIDCLRVEDGWKIGRLSYRHA